MYAAKSTACFCMISTVVLRGAVLVFFLGGGVGGGGNDLDLERK